ALHLRPFDDRQSMGPPRRPGVGRHWLDHGAYRPGPDRPGAPRHACAGPQEAYLSDLPPGPPIAEDRAVLAGQIAFVAAPTPIATEARAELVARYGECPLPQAVVVVALG